MRTSELDILIVPGWTNSGPDHWQSRWEAKLSTASRVDLGSWDRPERDAWTERLVGRVAAATRPALLVAHSLGVVAVAHAAPRLQAGKVAGAFLVALPDIERADRPPEIDAAFAPIPRQPLPFPSVLVVSDNDPTCAPARAHEFASAWGAATAEAGEAGHLNTESGHGPWPEGLLRLASFLKSLG